MGDVDTEMDPDPNIQLRDPSVADTCGGPPETEGDFNEGGPEGEKGQEGEGQNEDETVDKSEMSSDVSKGENLRVSFCFCFSPSSLIQFQGDLFAALEEDFDFKGTYACSFSYPAAPNPCLHISGIGLIGLPLPGRDAKLIKEYSTRAPFGHGDRTVVDTKVRETWEIEPDKIQFGNTEWASFLERVVLQTCEELGVAIEAKPPKCELYKLLLYETGSQ
jgi:hypothetical protein